MNEKGFLIGILGRTKRVFTKQAYEQGQIIGTGQDGNREWITCVAGICMDGTWLPPLLIYQAVSGNIQDSWVQDFDPDKHPCCFSSTKTGWTNDEMGFEWLSRVFDPNTKKKARQGRSWRLLIVDGHGSHLTMRFLDYCFERKIMVAVFPPHSTHRLQPLDVSLFSPLATAYTSLLGKWIHDTQLSVRFSKREFFALFWPAFEQAFTRSNIESGWRKTGLWPRDSSLVLDKIVSRPAQIPPQLSDQDSLSLAVEDLDSHRVRAAIKTIRSPKSRKTAQILSNQLVDVMTRLNIAETEIEGLKRAVQIEKTRRNRGKKLFEDPGDENGIKARVYTPSKIKAQREANLFKENAKIEEDRQKQQKKEDQIRKKEDKQRGIQERRNMREYARVQREMQAKEKAYEREDKANDKAAAKQLNKELNLVIQSTKKPKQVVGRKGKEIMVVELSDEDLGSGFVQKRSQRIKRLPRHLDNPDISLGSIV